MQYFSLNENKQRQKYSKNRKYPYKIGAEIFIRLIARQVEQNWKDK